MVGGENFASHPFNLATQGQRQPGSAFKPFVLATAIQRGISPSSVWASKKLTVTVPGTNGKEKFVVNNYEDSYLGSASLASATALSDNSVYVQVGMKAGLRRVARNAKELGIRTPVSRNPAMTLGGLNTGVTALDMAHAYSSLAEGGLRVTGTLGHGEGRPRRHHEGRAARRQVRRARHEPARAHAGHPHRRGRRDDARAAVAC